MLKFVNIFVFLPTGLYHDDCLFESPDVKEALRRIPEPVLNDRNFRMQRALHLSLTKKLLPKEEWISFEEVGSRMFCCISSWWLCSNFHIMLIVSLVYFPIVIPAFFTYTSSCLLMVLAHSKENIDLIYVLFPPTTGQRKGPLPAAFPGGSDQGEEGTWGME